MNSWYTYENDFGKVLALRIWNSFHILFIFNRVKGCTNFVFLTSFLLIILRLTIHGWIIGGWHIGFFFLAASFLYWWIIYSFRSYSTMRQAYFWRNTVLVTNLHFPSIHKIPNITHSASNRPFFWFCCSFVNISLVGAETEQIGREFHHHLLDVVVASKGKDHKKGERPISMATLYYLSNLTFFLSSRQKKRIKIDDGLGVYRVHMDTLLVYSLFVTKVYSLLKTSKKFVYLSPQQSSLFSTSCRCYYLTK